MESSAERIVKREPPYVDFRNSRLYFGTRFWIAIVIASVSITGSVLADASHPFGRAVLALVALAGVAIGILLQPSPKPEDHRPRARQAIEKLASTERFLADVRTMNSQLSDVEDLVRIRIGFASMNQDLVRASEHVVSSMAEWDQVAPGAFEEARATRNRGREMLIELAQKEGVADE